MNTSISQGIIITFFIMRAMMSSSHFIASEEEANLIRLLPSKPEKDDLLSFTSRGNSKNCGFLAVNLKTGDKGVISTPNYPRNYPPSLECIWWLKVMFPRKICTHPSEKMGPKY